MKGVSLHPDMSVRVCVQDPNVSRTVLPVRLRVYLDGYLSWDCRALVITKLSVL